MNILNKEEHFEIEIHLNDDIFKRLEKESFNYYGKIKDCLNQEVRNFGKIAVSTLPVSEIKDLTILGIHDHIRSSLRRFVSIRELAEIGVQKTNHYYQTPLIVILPSNEIIIMHKLEPGGRIEYLSDVSLIPPNAKLALKPKY
ncbi:MAG: hypothetical protein WC795_03405 [Candidatus Paceibacterota bacterium]